MQSVDYWRLCDHLSIFQSLMLILGYDPENQYSWDVENNRKHSSPTGYGALKTALTNAVKSHKITTICTEPEVNEYDGEYIESSVNIDKTIIEIESLKNFLRQKGLTDCFFFPEGNISEEYLDPQNQHHAPKLAAAVNAWKAVSNDPTLLNGKTPKQAMQKWLRENATRYGLTSDDGKLNETGIEEICKVANWQTGGGAARTPTIPTRVNDNSPSARKPQKLKIFGVQQSINDDFENDIPF